MGTVFFSLAFVSGVNIALVAPKCTEDFPVILIAVAQGKVSPERTSHLTTPHSMIIFRIPVTRDIMITEFSPFYDQNKNFRFKIAWSHFPAEYEI
jgi:hypothetical protein